MLILDGVLSIEEIAKSDLEYRKFIHELQQYAALEGFVALLLTNNAVRGFRPEHTMVDGLFGMEDADVGGGTRQRELEVLKFRGSDFLRGKHGYRITGEGLDLYPRIEALLAQPSPRQEDRGSPTGFPWACPTWTR